MPLPQGYRDLPETRFIDLFRAMISHAVNNQPADRENRRAWYGFGFELEWRVIQIINSILDYGLLEANRAKDGAGRSARSSHDLFYHQEGDDGRPGRHRGDLKCQFTPFFLARTEHDCDPRTHVTFNEKDRNNYNLNYGEDFIIVFYVNHWLAHSENTECSLVGDGDAAKLLYRGTRLTPLHGAYACRLKTVHGMIDRREIVQHFYRNRANDDRNARSSWLLPVTSLVTLFELEGNPLIL